MEKKYKKLSDDKQTELLADAKKRAKESVTWWKDNHDLAKNDIAFLDGAQWPAEVMSQRDEEGRPYLTLNHLPKFLDQVLGDQRQNRPSITVHPVEADNDKFPNLAGTKDYTLSEIMQSIIRNIEYSSGAEMHYDEAFQHAAESGFGWLRVTTEYANDSTFEQEAKIKCIPNRFAVLPDPMAQEPDMSDMNYCFIIQRMQREDFEEKYPDAKFGAVAEDGIFEWGGEDTVTVAEYFVREPKNITVCLLSDGRTVKKDDIEEITDELAEAGITVTRERKVKSWCVKWYKITNTDVLEGPKEWPGARIPVVPVLGKKLIVDGKPVYKSVIRNAHDAQRMHNFWMTAATEKVALAPKAPYVGTAESVKGHEQQWKTANTKNHSVLLYNEGHQPPQREMPAAMPSAEIQMAMAATDEIKNAIGMFDASLGMRGNETSGRAIIARQREADVGTFAYTDNLNRAIRKLGLILLEVIPVIYDTERVMRLRFEDDTGDWVKVNQQVPDRQTGQVFTVADLSVGKFDVVVKSGPSYTTQREATVETLMSIMQAVPGVGGAIADLIVKNVDGPGADEMAKRLKKTLPAHLLDPEDKEEVPQPQPTPEQQQEAAKLQLEQQKLQQEQQKMQYDTQVMQIEQQHEIQKLQMEKDIQRLKNEVEIAKLQQKQTGGAIDPAELRPLIRVAVADAIAELETEQENAATAEQPPIPPTV